MIILALDAVNVLCWTNLARYYENTWQKICGDMVKCLIGNASRIATVIEAVKGNN
jgi:hypothetical protein